MGKKIKKSNHTNNIIGVIGTEHGVGTTHFCFMLGVYMGIVMGKRIAVVEQNESGCLGQAEIILNNLIKNKVKKITKYISIYNKSDVDELSSIISMGYDCVIVDYGCDYDNLRNSFLMCPEKIVVGSLSWWKIHSMVKFLVKTQNEKSFGHWKFLTATPVKAGIKYIAKEFNINILVIPNEPDPFCLSSKNLKFFQNLAEKLF